MPRWRGGPRVYRIRSMWVLAVILIVALLFVVSNLLVDISYAYFDPRIRYEEKAR